MDAQPMHEQPNTLIEYTLEILEVHFTPGGPAQWWSVPELVARYRLKHWATRSALQTLIRRGLISEDQRYKPPLYARVGTKKRHSAQVVSQPVVDAEVADNIPYIPVQAEVDVTADMRERVLTALQTQGLPMSISLLNSRTGLWRRDLLATLQHLAADDLVTLSVDDRWQVA